MPGIVEVRAFEATCPAGTPKASAVVIDMSMPPRTVLKIRVRIPPGPNGLMGFAIGAVGTAIIPTNEGEWIVASDEEFEWTIPGQINSGAWQAIMYNDGIYDHTIYVTFTVELPAVPGANANAPIIAPQLLAPPIPTPPPLVLPNLPAAPVLVPA